MICCNFGFHDNITTLQFQYNYVILYANYKFYLKLKCIYTVATVCEH